MSLTICDFIVRGIKNINNIDAINEIFQRRLRIFFESVYFDIV